MVNVTKVGPSVDVRPRYFASNPPYGLTCNAENSSKFRTAKTACTDEPDFVGADFEVPVNTAFGWRHRPSATFSVFQVLALRPDTEVCGLDANGPVATVSNDSAVRYGSVEDFVADPVGAELLPQCGDVAVATGYAAAAPVPTAVVGRGFRHVPKERLAGRQSMGFMHGNYFTLGKVS